MDIKTNFENGAVFCRIMTNLKLLRLSSASLAPLQYKESLDIAEKVGYSLDIMRNDGYELIDFRI